MLKSVLIAFVAACVPLMASAQGAAVLRTETLRAEPYTDAQAVAELPVGARVQLFERKGNWANAEYQGKRGWLRALNLKADGAAALKAEGVLALQTGRAAQGGAIAVPLAVRSAKTGGPAHKVFDEVIARRDNARPFEFTARITGAGDLAMALDSARAGYSYVFAADASGQVLRCLYPSAAHPDNEIAAARPLSFSVARTDAAAGGQLRLLGLVADAPLDLVFEEKEPEGAYFKLVVTETNRARIAHALAAGGYMARVGVLQLPR